MKNEKYKPIASLSVIALQLRKILFLIIFLGSLIFPLISFSQGLVPCGYDLNGDGVFDPATEGCQLCHFFVMFDNILDFVFINLVPPVAVLMLVIGGFLFFFAGSPAALTRAKSIITTTIIGLLIIYAAWIIINTFFMIIGVADWTGLREGWFTIDCPVT